MFGVFWVYYFFYYFFCIFFMVLEDEQMGNYDFLDLPLKEFNEYMDNLVGDNDG